MLCDDDDFITETHLERSLKELQNADFIYFDAEIVQFEKEETPAIHLKGSSLHTSMILQK